MQILKLSQFLNKIDMSNSDIDGSIVQVKELLGCDESDILQISAKTGKGIDDIIKAIINKVPSPKIDNSDNFKALIFDSYYDQYRGIVIYIKVFSGSVSKNMTAKFFKYNQIHEILEVGNLGMTREPRHILKNGDVGYMIINVKDVSKIKVGDTVTTKESESLNALSGYKPVKPMVFSGMYPIVSKDFENLRLSLDRLKLNDSSLSYEANTSLALGFGFRCGFLGPLHMEIVQERLETRV